MTAGELRALLELVPDDTPILSVSTWHAGICHVDSVWRRDGIIQLGGSVSHEAPAPTVTIKGRWPKRPPAPKKPVDRDTVAANLIAVMQEV